MILDDEWKKAIIERGVYFVESGIPTELYMMLEPSIYLAGYISSTFLSTDLLYNPTEQILSIWNYTDCRIKTNCLDFTAKTAMNIENGKVVIYTKNEPPKGN